MRKSYSNIISKLVEMNTMSQANPDTQPGDTAQDLQMKMWIYTNFDCNLRCSYCVAESSPRAPRREIGVDKVKQLVDEAQCLGFEHVYFTGGEPLILNNLFEMLAYSSDRLPTTLLTNAMLLRGKRLEKLCEIRNDNLVIQVSLDGARPEQHDPFRGVGSWAKTVEGINSLQQNSFRVRLSTTETPANSACMEEICEYHRSLGIAEEDHIIRPLAKRGFSNEGMDVGKQNISPEITITKSGVYWHPLSTDPDMMVSERIFPLAEAVSKLSTELKEPNTSSTADLQTFQ
jgi:MoaA/NifB/PqqE/SkfB family radical SAM enzyme